MMSRPDSGFRAPASVFAGGGGAMGARLRSFDWGSTPLQSIGTWTDALRMTVDQMMASHFPACLFWGEDLIMIYNDGYTPILGDKPDALGQPLAVVWSEVWDSLEPMARRALEGEPTFIEDFALQAVRHNGVAEEAFFTFCYSPVFDANGQVVGVMDTVVETTSKVLAERSAREQNEHRLELERQLREFTEAALAKRTAERDVLARLVEATDARIQVVDMDFRFLAINRANIDEYMHLFGLCPKVGDSLLDVLAQLPLASDREAGRAMWDRVMAGESFRTSREWGEGDAKRWFDMSFEVLRGQDGVQIGASLTGTDITERRLNELALAQAQEALRQAQKMEAVGQLTGGLAHDFNNLLSTISSSLQVIRLKLERGLMDDLSRYLDMGENSVRRAAALTQRLLAFSRRQILDPRPTDINELLQGMEELIRRSMGPDIELHFKPAIGLWGTRIDVSQLENAVLNLCINARDAMAPLGGRLSVSSANVHLSGQGARDVGAPEGDYVRLSVADTGTGIPPDDVARIFDPFFTTKPIGQGTGLGLSMVYGFVRQSDGHVQVQTQLGQGTALHLYLPRYIGEAQTIEPLSDSSSHLLPAGTGETLLLVEDEEALRLLLTDVLQEAGYRVLTAADGPAALQLLKESGHIDLLISDVGLPGGFNGRQVADAARIMQPGLKILFVTGYVDNAAVGNGMMEPGMEVMTKPFEIAALAARVRGMLDATI